VDETSDIDILVNNAGVPVAGSILSDPSDFDEAMKAMVCPAPALKGFAKAAHNALTAASARSVPYTVKINAMCPGWVCTPMGGMGATHSPAEGAPTAWN
jgi:NAD(P)-dependent dehydrogenase (short-subunit alcohol dehydrogenase family)